MELKQYIKSNKIKGVIFDMDGTLTDSMGKWKEIYSKLAEHLHITLSEDFLMKYNHVSMKGIVHALINEFSLQIDENSLYEFWTKQVVKYYENIFKIKPYMLEVLKELKMLGIEMAIATASDRRCAEAFIKSNNLTEYIHSVTGLEEVNRPKCFPDIYWTAARKINVTPSECIVFEDALVAIKSAKSGGFKICGVQDDASSFDEEEIKSLSDFILGF